jgi:hypothetical protein
MGEQFFCPQEFDKRNSEGVDRIVIERVFTGSRSYSIRSEEFFLDENSPLFAKRIIIQKCGDDSR